MNLKKSHRENTYHVRALISHRNPFRIDAFVTGTDCFLGYSGSNKKIIQCDGFEQIEVHLSNHMILRAQI